MVVPRTSGNVSLAVLKKKRKNERQKGSLDKDAEVKSSCPEVVRWELRCRRRTREGKKKGPGRKSSSRRCGFAEASASHTPMKTCRSEV